MINKKTGKKTITIKYSDFYMCYFVWTDLTEKELREIEGVKNVYRGLEYFEVSVDEQYDEEIVLRNIKGFASAKKQKTTNAIN